MFKNYWYYLMGGSCIRS